VRQRAVREEKVARARLKMHKKRTDTTVSRTSSYVLTRRIESTRKYFTLNTSCVSVNYFDTRRITE
jgi:hypothetical protein